MNETYILEFNKAIFKLKQNISIFNCHIEFNHTKFDDTIEMLKLDIYNVLHDINEIRKSVNISTHKPHSSFKIYDLQDNKENITGSNKRNSSRTTTNSQGSSVKNQKTLLRTVNKSVINLGNFRSNSFESSKRYSTLNIKHLNKIILKKSDQINCSTQGTFDKNRSYSQLFCQFDRSASKKFPYSLLNIEIDLIDKEQKWEENQHKNNVVVNRNNILIEIYPEFNDY